MYFELNLMFTDRGLTFRKIVTFVFITNIHFVCIRTVGDFLVREKRLTYEKRELVSRGILVQGCLGGEYAAGKILLFGCKQLVKGLID